MHGARGAWRTLAAAVEPLASEFLGAGLVPPARALHEAGFRPDAPWRWCPRCGAVHDAGRGAHDAAPASCLRPRGGVAHDAAASVPVVRLGAHAGPLRDWILRIKHAQWEAMAETLGALLGRQLVRCGVVLPGEEGVAMVAVPTPWLRRRTRGIDHTAVLAAAAARAAGLRAPALLRQRSVGTQVHAGSRAARLARQGRFHGCRRMALPIARWRLAGMRIVLLDDVRTTGATLAELAAAVQLAGGTPIAAAVLAVKE
ncbi:MAG: hypothetical protein U0625_02405 [Phycisphaerales bacterium]